MRAVDTSPSRIQNPSALERAIQPADMLLVAGNRKISTAIKYLTQSTWSHAAHHNLFAPCDFDLSPYFQIVRPGLEAGFDHKAFVRPMQSDWDPRARRT